MSAECPDPRCGFRVQTETGKRRNESWSAEKANRIGGQVGATDSPKDACLDVVDTTVRINEGSLREPPEHRVACEVPSNRIFFDGHVCKRPDFSSHRSALDTPDCSGWSSEVVGFGFEGSCESFGGGSGFGGASGDNEIQVGRSAAERAVPDPTPSDPTR